MSSGPHFPLTTPKTPVIGPPRLKLRPSRKPKAPTPGYVERIWVGSRNLAAELPVPLAVPAVRLGRRRG
jgi:hypothetical protein